MKKTIKVIASGLLWFFSFLTLCLLHSCAEPIYKTTYQYQKPFSSSAMSCIDACERDLSYCNLRVQQESNVCEYQQKDSDESSDSAQKLEPSQYSSTSDDCDKEQRSCHVTYDQCFVSCGGQVVPKKQCVKNCPR